MDREKFNSYLDELTEETGISLDKIQKAFAYHAAIMTMAPKLELFEIMERFCRQAAEERFYQCFSFSSGLDLTKSDREAILHHLGISADSVVDL